MILNPHGQRTANAVAFARSADNKDRWTLLISPATARRKFLIINTTTGGHPACSRSDGLGDDKTVHFNGERDDGRGPSTQPQLTGRAEAAYPGKFEVSDMRIWRTRRSSISLPARATWANATCIQCP